MFIKKTTEDEFFAGFEEELTKVASFQKNFRKEKISLALEHLANAADSLTALGMGEETIDELRRTPPGITGGVSNVAELVADLARIIDERKGLISQLEEKGRQESDSLEAIQSLMEAELEG